MSPREVVIDGVRYVPATDVAPDIRSVLARLLLEVYTHVDDLEAELARWGEELTVVVRDRSCRDADMSLLELLDEFSARLVRQPTIPEEE